MRNDFVSTTDFRFLAADFIIHGFHGFSRIGRVDKGLPLQQFYKADFVCFDKIVVELKAVAELKKEHAAQVINYLKATALKIGVLVNFANPKGVEVQ